MHSREIYPYTLTHEVFEKIFEANKNIKPDEITSITVSEGVRRILVNNTTFSKNLTKINLHHSLEYLYWRGLFNKNKFPDLLLGVNGLKYFYDKGSMIMYFYDDAENPLNKRIISIRLYEDDIKIKVPKEIETKSEEKIGLLIWLLNLFSKIREFFRNLFVGQKKIKQLPGGKDKTRGKQISKSDQKKICPVEVIKTPVQIKSGNKISLPKMKNMKGDEKTIGG